MKRHFASVHKAVEHVQKFEAAEGGAAGGGGGGGVRAEEEEGAVGLNEGEGHGRGRV